MFDIAFTEMMLLAVVVILVVGPKDLPKIMRTVGGWMRKARGMAREFQGSIEQIARESELGELRNEANRLKNFDPNAHLEKTIDPSGELRGELRGNLGGKFAASAKGGDGGGVLGALSDGPTPAKMPSDEKSKPSPKPSDQAKGD